MIDSEREAFETEIKKLRCALEFYACAQNWKSPSTGFALQYDPEPSAINKDHGERALEALK